MIKFNLICDQAHEFESWFGNSDVFEAQIARALVNCPQCGSSKISKAIMAPHVAAKTRLEKGAAPQSALSTGSAVKMRAAMQAFRQHVLENATDVGEKFPEEARKQHFGEVEEKPIYGKATPQDVEELLDDGVAVMPLPDGGN